MRYSTTTALPYLLAREDLKCWENYEDQLTQCGAREWSAVEWNGLVLWVDQNRFLKVAMSWRPPGKRKQGKPENNLEEDCRSWTKTTTPLMRRSTTCCQWHYNKKAHYHELMFHRELEDLKSKIKITTIKTEKNKIIK